MSYTRVCVDYFCNFLVNFVLKNFGSFLLTQKSVHLIKENEKNNKHIYQH